MDAQLIASIIRGTALGDASDAATCLGEIRLRPHQHDAVERLHDAIARHGGALLADDPGMGKTYVALAVAARHARPLVVAPAVVREAWQRSARRAAVAIEFVSYERLSRSPLESPNSGLVILDEAQHAGAVGTARRRAIERLCVARPVLLLTATPVRNRISELHDLLALFLGRGATPDPGALAQCVVRREARGDDLPSVAAPRVLPVRRTSALDAAIASLPAAAPLQGGGTATRLVAIGLLRCRDSSIAALRVALLQRLQRGAALEAALSQGEWPSARELRRWIAGDYAIQLQLPLDAPTPNAGAWLSTVREHCAAVRTVLLDAERLEAADTASRVARLHEVLTAHADVPVIAFSQFAATARALYAAMRHEPHVALLTASGARSASGARARGDLIAALEPGEARSRPAHDRLRLLISTDLLSEGVNLQRAGVVVHLDLPWTPARLRQRIGRVARIGGERQTVFSYRFSSRRDAPDALAMLARHRRKARDSTRATSASDASERLRACLAAWPTAPRVPRAPSDLTPLEAVVLGRRSGCLAVIDRAGVRTLVGIVTAGARHRATTDPAALTRLVGDVTLPLAARAGTVESARRADRARETLARWLARRRASRSLGADHMMTSLRRRLLQRAAESLRRTPAAAQRRVSEAVRELRAALAAAPAAGVEPIIARLLDREPATPLDWLRSATSELRAAAQPIAPRQSDDATPRVAALLIITPAAEAPSPPAGAPEPPAVPRATWS